MTDYSDEWRQRIQPIEPEGFRFQPWMGVAVSALVFLVAGREGHGWMILRALAMTGFFTSLAISHRRRRQPGERWSASELQSVVFAGFCALLTLGFIIEWVIDNWPW